MDNPAIASAYEKINPIHAGMAAKTIPMRMSTLPNAPANEKVLSNAVISLLSFFLFSLVIIHESYLGFIHVLY